jgi:cob(I)alamin adenosyltransferase
MNIQLIHGDFNAKDASEIITQMIQVKIKYHENKISQDHNEEDIKFREAKIKRLQKDLHDTRSFIEGCSGKITIQCDMHLSN